MAEMDEKEGATAGGASEFEAMFEESLRTVKPGGVVKGRVVGNEDLTVPGRIPNDYRMNVARLVIGLLPRVRH